MKNAARIICGIVIAFIGQFFAIMLAGAGHGWNTPFRVSLVLWLAYPATLMRVKTDQRHSFDLALLVLAALADIGLVAFTRFEGVEYFVRVVRFPGAWWVIGVWVLIWLGWQIAVPARLMQSR